MRTVQNRGDKGLFKDALIFSAYITYLLVLIKFSNTQVNQLIVLLGLIPLAIPLCGRFLIPKRSRKNFLKVTGIVLFFYLSYSFISTNNIKVPFRGLSYFLIYLEHALIIYWFLRKKSFLDVRRTILALLLVSIFVVFIPHLMIAGSLKLGAFYNLLSPDLLTVTTLEAPLIVALLCLLSIFNYIFNKDRSFLSLFSLFFSVFLLLLFNRRGFIFSSIISVCIYYFYVRSTNRVILYASFLLLFLPMFWDSISSFVVDLSNNELFSSIIVRNNKDELVTATGRAIAWLSIMQLFFSFKSNYLFGFYGGPPTDLFLTTEENGRFEHAHNTFLQLFLEGGYYINCLFIFMLIVCFKNYANLKKANKRNHNFYVVMLIFLFSLSATESLIREIQFSSFIFCYILIGCLFISYKNSLIPLVNDREKNNIAKINLTGGESLSTTEI